MNKNIQLLQMLVPFIFEAKTYGHLPKIQSRRFWGVNQFGFAAYKTDAEIASEKKQKAIDDLKAITDKETELKAIKIEKPEDFTKAFTLYKEIAALKDKNVDEKLAAIEAAQQAIKEAKPEVTAAELQALKEDLDITIKAFDKLQIRMKNTTPAGPEQKKSFNDVLEETIKAHEAEIKTFKKGDSEKRFEMKAVGDMSVGVNFPNAGTFNVDIRNQLIETPYNRVWLADVLPQGNSNGSSILYPKENGGEGGAALWTDKTQDKPQFDFDLTGQSAYFKWIAGFVIIEREMLDDIPFLTSYLRSKMLISLKIAENAFILNGSADANPVTGMLAAATAYDGSYAADVDRIIDAAYGQIVEDTFDFYNPTSVILTPRDSVSIGLNKALGSGEYDLPDGSAGFARGQLSVAGLQVVKTTSVGSGNFIAFDKAALMFVKRMQPELRMFEDAALAKRNKIMFRVEERATLAIFNNAAIVKGTIAGAES